MILRHNHVSSKKPYRTKLKYELVENQGSASPADILPSVFSDELCQLAVGSHKKIDRQSWEASLRFFGNKCAYCRQKFTKTRLATRDHVVPKCRGGKTNVHNIVPACLDCNGKKGYALLAEFANSSSQDIILNYFTSTAVRNAKEQTDEEKWWSAVSRIEVMLANIAV